MRLDVSSESSASSNRESPAQFENLIKPQVYVRHIRHSTMYGKAPFVSRNWRKES